MNVEVCGKQDIRRSIYVIPYEHRFVNGFMSDKLWDYRENHKRKVAEGFRRAAETMRLVPI